MACGNRYQMIQVPKSAPLPTNRDAIVLQGWLDVVRKQTDALSLVAIFIRNGSEDPGWNVLVLKIMSMVDQCAH